MTDETRASGAAPNRLTGVAMLTTILLGLSMPVLAEAEPPFAAEPLETLGDDYRVREGHVSPVALRSSDAETASRGVVAGAAPALYKSLLLRGYDVWVADLGAWLHGNRDGDSFFSAVEFTLDVDTESVTEDVYAVITLTDAAGYLTVEHVSATFSLFGRASSDAYRIEIELLQNHAPGYRDAYIEIRDAFDGRLLDNLTPYDHAALADLPLESRFDDNLSHIDDGFGPDHPDSSGIVGGFAFTGSSSHQDHEDDTYVGAYAGGTAPLALLLLFGLVAWRCGAYGWPSKSRLFILRRKLQLAHRSQLPEHEELHERIRDDSPALAGRP